MPLLIAKVSSGFVVYWHTVVLPVNVTVGNERTVITIPPAAEPHTDAAASLTPVNEYVKSPAVFVGALIVAVLTSEVVLTVCAVPPLML